MRMEKASETDGVEDISQFSSSDIPLSLSVHFGGTISNLINFKIIETVKNFSLFIWSQING